MFNIKEKISIIRNFARVMTARTGSTHNLVVALLSALISKRLDKDPAKAYISGLLHDIGGIGIFESIITEPLSLSEWPRDIDEITFHPNISYSMVKDLLTIEFPWIREHHELYNGRGYPEKKRGSEISLEGYVLGISDKIEILSRSVAYNIREVLGTLREWRNNWFPDCLVDEAIALFVEDKSLLYDVQQSSSTEKRLIEIEDTVDFSSLRIEERNLFGFFSKSISLKHPYTREHSERVASLSKKLGIKAGLSKKDTDELETAAFLHDIGKVVIPRGVMDKPSSLTPHETRIIREHSLKTYEILNISRYTEHIALIAASHHEAFDGSGYPIGLMGEEIPLGSRIINVVDIYDALLSVRSYRDAMTVKEALGIMETDFKGKIDADIFAILREESKSYD